MLGFDAIGRLALGQAPGLTFTLTAAIGNFAETGIAATFIISQLSNTGAFSVAGLAALFPISMLSSVGTYYVGGVSSNFITVHLASSAAYIINANTTFLTRDYVNWVRDGSPTTTWTADSAPSSVWMPKATPTTTWTNDPNQYIAPSRTV